MDVSFRFNDLSPHVALAKNLSNLIRRGHRIRMCDKDDRPCAWCVSLPPGRTSDIVLCILSFFYPFLLSLTSK